MAPSVHLDFVSRARPRWPWLLAAGAMLLVALTHHGEVRDRLEAAQLKQREPGFPRSGPASRPAIPDLQWPWRALLDSLENARQEKIALLALEAEGRTGQVRLLAETPEPQNLQPYLQTLASQGLRSPRLSRQEMLEQEDGPSLIQFSVEASWQP